jgi:MAPEG family
MSLTFAAITNPKVIAPLAVPGLAAIGLLVQQASFYANVGAARAAAKVEPPARKSDTDGGRFERIYCAAQNRAEWLQLFLAADVAVALTVCPYLATTLAGAYAFASHKYVHGYAESAAGRGPGFHLGLQVFFVTVGLATGGLLSTLLQGWFNVDLLATLHVRGVWDSFRRLTGQL